MVGAGMSKFGAFAEKNSRDLFVESYKVMTRSVDKGLDPSVIDAVYIGNFSSDQFEHQAHIAPILADAVGLDSEEMEWAEASGRGRLAGFTVIYSGPTFMVEQGFDRTTPYISGIVELEEGASISARITGLDVSKPEEIKVGMPLTVDFVEFGEGDAKKTYLAFKV